MTDLPNDGPTPRTANVRNWHQMTSRDFAALDPTKVVVTVSCSPMEVHGPHLPVVTDNLEAEGITARTIELMADRHPEITFLRLMPIYVAADVVPHRGSLMFRQSTIVAVLSDLGRTLALQGFKDVWVASFHGGPRHFVSIEQACHLTNKRYDARMVSLFSLLAKRISEGTSNLAQVLGHIRGLSVEELDGDTHGGAIETSMMLYLLGKFVDPTYKTIPRSTVDLKLAAEGKAGRASKPGKASVPALLRGFKASMKYFEAETYAGKPSIGSAEIGEEIVDVLARKATDTLSDLWTRKIPPAECHSPVWPLKWVFLSPQVSWLFERAVRYQNPIF